MKLPSLNHIDKFIFLMWGIENEKRKDKSKIGLLKNKRNLDIWSRKENRFGTKSVTVICYEITDTLVRSLISGLIG